MSQINDNLKKSGDIVQAGIAVKWMLSQFHSVSYYKDIVIQEALVSAVQEGVMVTFMMDPGVWGSECYYTQVLSGSVIDIAAALQASDITTYVNFKNITQV